jgi:hypothetical protein
VTDDSALAALAIQLTALKGNLSKVRGELDAARREFAAQLAEVAAQLEDLATREGKSPTAIYWPGLDEAARLAALEVLSAWVNQMRQWHPGYFAVVAECWPGHPEAVVELSNVMGEHTRIYRKEQPPLADALVFYDRWLPGMLRRLAEVMRACGPAGCSKSSRLPYKSWKASLTRLPSHLLTQGFRACGHETLSVFPIEGRPATAVLPVLDAATRDFSAVLPRAQVAGRAGPYGRP